MRSPFFCILSVIYALQLPWGKMDFRLWTEDNAQFSTTGFFAGELDESCVLNADSSPTHDWYAVFIAWEITTKYIGIIYASVVCNDIVFQRAIQNGIKIRCFQCKIIRRDETLGRVVSPSQVVAQMEIVPPHGKSIPSA